MSLLATDKQKEKINRTCLKWREVMREEKYEAQAEEERDLAKPSVQIRRHGASVAVTEEVWHDQTSIA